MKERSRTTNSIINVIVSLGSQLLLTALQFVYRTVFVQTLGTPYLGINGLFTNILMMLSLTELGLDTAITYKLYKPLAEKDTRRLQILMKFYRFAYLVIGISILFIGLCLIPFLPTLIKDYNTLGPLGIDPILIYLLNLIQTVTSYLFFASKSAILKADQKIYISTIIEFWATVILNIVQIVTLILYRNFVLNTTLGLGTTVIANVFIAFIAIKKYPEVFKRTEERLSKEEIKDIFKDLGALFVYRVNNVVIKATDNIVLSAFIGISTVGLYSNYLLFYTTINSIGDRILTSVKASVGNFFAIESTEKKYSMFQIMNYITFILYGTAAVGVAVCADALIEVWIGIDYVITTPFSILIGIEILFHGIKGNLGQIRNVSGIFRQMWYRPVIGIVINIGVSIALVNVCGIYGVIIGTICSDVLANFMIDPSIIYRYCFNNVKPVSHYYIDYFKYISLLICIGIGDLSLCNLIVPNNTWLSVIIRILICAISTPTVFAIVFRKRHENQYIMTKVYNIIRKVFKR